MKQQTNEARSHTVSVYEALFYLRYAPRRFEVIVDGERYKIGNRRKAANKVEELSEKDGTVELSYGNPVIVRTKSAIW